MSDWNGNGWASHIQDEPPLTVEELEKSRKQLMEISQKLKVQELERANQVDRLNAVLEGRASTLVINVPSSEGFWWFKGDGYDKFYLELVTFEERDGHAVLVAFPVEHHRSNQGVLDFTLNPGTWVKAERPS